MPPGRRSPAFVRIEMYKQTMWRVHWTRHLDRLIGAPGQITLARLRTTLHIGAAEGEDEDALQVVRGTSNPRVIAGAARGHDLRLRVGTFAAIVQENELVTRFVSVAATHGLRIWLFHQHGEWRVRSGMARSSRILHRLDGSLTPVQAYAVAQAWAQEGGYRVVAPPEA
jgi:hypothetical protein